MALMLWLYVVTAAVLLGGEVDAALHRRRRGRS
jgi:uncharacterized BrkB/YihY/UPF0761 family membrane protein